MMASAVDEQVEVQVLGHRRYPTWSNADATCTPIAMLPVAGWCREA
jgi:hypothetical protein